MRESGDKKQFIYILVLFHAGTFYLLYRKNLCLLIIPGILKRRSQYLQFLRFPHLNKWKLFICYDQLNKKVTKTPVTHTGKQSEKSFGVMLFPMEGSHEYDKTI